MKSPTILGAVLVIAVILSPICSAQFELSTPLDNFADRDGLMFDLHAYSDLRITGIDTCISGGPTLVEVWMVAGGTSYVGLENSPGAWILLGSTQVNPIFPAALTPLGIALDIDLDAAQDLGLYVTTMNGLLRCTPGSTPGSLLTANNDLAINEGIGISYPFATVIGGSGKFNGRIHYSRGNTGEPGSLSLSVTPDYLVPGLIFDIEAKDSVVIDGFTPFLYGSNIDLQVWTTIDGQPSTGIENDPSKWILVGQAGGLQGGFGSLTSLPIDLHVAIPGNSRRGFYISDANLPGAAILGVNSSLGVNGVFGRDGSIGLATGHERAPGFAGSSTTPLAYSGLVHYRRSVPTPQIGSLAGSLAISPATTTSSDNGIFFDVEATDFVQLTTVEGLLLSSNHTIQLWRVTDGTSYVGKIGNPSLWTLVGQNNYTGPTGGLLTLFSDLRLQLDPGATQGFYLTVTDTSFPLASFAPPSGAIVATNSQLTVRSGLGATFPFVTTTASRAPALVLSYRYNGYVLSSLREDFANAVGTQAPSGWLTGLRRGNDFSQDGWNFSNPGGRSPGQPITAPFAICDSDFSGQNNLVDCVLVSPPFDASLGRTQLSFDHWHRYLNSVIYVDVWNGFNWNNVFVTTLQVDDGTRSVFDITAAVSGNQAGRVRFRFVGNWDWWWVIDNVAVETIGRGQEPRPGLGILDLNWAVELNGGSVATNLPGPYYSLGSSLSPAHFHFEGEAMQPLMLLQGQENVNGWDFLAAGKLDIGIFDPLTSNFGLLEVLADGTMPGFINGLFVTNAAGQLDLQFPLPTFTIGFSYNFQAAIFSSRINIALTNMVTMSVIN